MSNYQKQTKNPKTGEWENAWWYDDYFGKHCYGVVFPSDPNIAIDVEEIKLETRDNQAPSTFDKISKQTEEMANVCADAKDAMNLNAAEIAPSTETLDSTRVGSGWDIPEDPSTEWGDRKWVKDMLINFQPAEFANSMVQKVITIVEEELASQQANLKRKLEEMKREIGHQLPCKECSPSCGFNKALQEVLAILNQE